MIHRNIKVSAVAMLLAATATPTYPSFTAPPTPTPHEQRAERRRQQRASGDTVYINCPDPMPEVHTYIPPAPLKPYGKKARRQQRRGY